MEPSLHDPANFLLVTIDGGAASGKSTAARGLAQERYLFHVDSGAFYRALTFALLRSWTDFTDPNALARACAVPRLAAAREGNTARIVLDGRVVPDALLRTDAVNAAISRLAAVPEAREVVTELLRDQQIEARAHGFAGLVMEGRDIGSVVFPAARHKFYLVADPEIAAQRRQQEGLSESPAQRDALDSSRKTAPLSVPDGATTIDTTHLSPEEVLAEIGKSLS